MGFDEVASLQLCREGAVEKKYNKDLKNMITCDLTCADISEVAELSN